MADDITTRPRPAPRADAESAPYWDAAAEDRLAVQRCTVCGHMQLYPRPWCLRCRGAVEWIGASGLGTVYSFTVIRQNFLQPFRDELPYVVALVDLDEGPRLMTNVVGCEPDAVTVGARVRAQFLAVADDARVPVFELVPAG
jgi:uncharacterized OB-fold protein